jgi:tRNA (guanine-N(1)-)-methyltransferase
MLYYVMTLFPEMIEYIMAQSIIGRALSDELINLKIINIRDYAKNRYRQVDDYPYGGGAGMLMQADPIYSAYKDICQNSEKKPRLIYTSPQGRLFDQNLAKELAKEEEIIFLCGHYEGVDERVLELTGAESVSIGDYVLTGGELASVVMMDAISRMIKGVLSNEDSAEFESFEDSLLEYPQYTRPAVYEGMEVPEVLLSGHHKNIEEWKRKESLRRTFERRPELLDPKYLSAKDLIFLQSLGYEIKSKQ